MLDAFDPLTLVHRTIRPFHFSMPVPFVLHIISFIPIPTFPGEHSLSVLLVIEVVSFVLVRIHVLALLPLPFPLFQPFHEVAQVRSSRLPPVLPVPLWTPESVLASEGVAIAEDVGASAVLEAVDPLALVLVPILPRVHSVALGFALLPLANVAVSVDTPPNPLPVLHPIDPLALEYLAILPSVDASSMRFVVTEISLVRVAIDIVLDPLPMSFVILPLPLVLPAFVVNHHSEALPDHFPLLPVDLQVALVHRVLVPLFLHLVLVELLLFLLLLHHFLFLVFARHFLRSFLFLLRFEFRGLLLEGRRRRRVLFVLLHLLDLQTVGRAAQVELRLVVRSFLGF